MAQPTGTARAAFDRHMMAIALGLAKRGLGTTGVNPCVGAIIADEASGEIIARGVTQPGGRPHAEKVALSRAGARARGQTMYVTLEPCAHTGRNPTCADGVLASGINRLVCAIADPNPVIAGRGLEDLANAGVTVETGLMAAEARWVTLGHILRQTEARPFVQLKLALDANLAVAAGNGAPVWVTSPEARAYAHLLRAETHAILVGAGTVIADDPELTCRLPGMAARSPRRVIVSGEKPLRGAARVFAGAQGGAPTLVFATERTRGAASIVGAEIATVGADADGWPAPAAMLAALAARGTHRLLVEGGPRMWAAFLAAGHVDEALVVVAPGAAGAKTIPVIAGDLDRHFAAHGLIRAGGRALGPDRLHVFRRSLA